MKRIWKRRRTRAFASVGVLGAMVGVPMLFVNWCLYRQNLSVEKEGFPAMPEPRARDRLLIFAPHCDDETLGCGGLIAMARRIGAAIKIVVVTNGDASFSTAMSSVKISPAQHIEMGYTRQGETLAAMRELGLSEDDVIFLGYPDGGTAAMWFDCWNERRLYKSKFTRKDRSPYRNSFRPQAPYCGTAELEDIRRIIEEFKPTAVYSTHPNDVHRDHWATHAFVTAVLESLKLEGDRAAQKARHFTYLIHRGDGWPAPKKYAPHERLLPPAKLMNSDTRWLELRLDDETQRQKHRALLQYGSQLKTMRKWMMAFVRRTELFGVVPPVEVRESRGQWGDGMVVPVVLRDPVNDSFTRDVMGRGDIAEVEAEVNEASLYLRVNLNKNASAQMVYDVALHGIGTEAGSESRSPQRSRDKAHIMKYTIRLQVPDRVKVLSVNGVGPVEIASDLRFKADGKSLHLVVPRSLLGNPRVVLLAASSAFHGLTVDKTAYKVLRLPE